MSRSTAGDWQFVPIPTWPFGFRIMAGDVCVLQQYAICTSTSQNTRQDNELGVGFDAIRSPKSTMPTIEEAQALIAEQDANGRAMAASRDLLKALKGALTCAPQLLRMPIGEIILAAIRKAEPQE